MPARTVRIWPDSALTTPTQPVVDFGPATQALVDDLFATMHAEKGIGLAANQVGEMLSVLVVDLDGQNERAHDKELDEDLVADNFEGPLALINPKVVASHGKIRWEEGCLSVPGVTETVERKAEVVVEAQNAQGEPIRVTARGLFAVCIQHEMDHLAGKVFVEYLSQLKRDVIRRKMVRLYGDEMAAAVPAKKRAIR